LRRIIRPPGIHFGIAGDVSYNENFIYIVSKYILAAATVGPSDSVRIGDRIRYLWSCSKLQVLSLGFLIVVAFVLRLAYLDVAGQVYDEGLTRAVVDNVLHGDLRNNWKFADVPAQYRVDFYNFSSYFYVDAAFVKLADGLTGAPPARPLHWHRVGSAIAGTLAIFFFYLLARRWFGCDTALIFLAFGAVAPILVQDAHYARPEAFEILLVAAVYLLSASFHAKFRYFVLGAACACVGLLGATKFSLLPMLGVVLLWIPPNLWKHGATATRVALTVIVATVLGMFVGVPDAFFHPAGYWNGVEFLRHQYAGVHVPHGNLLGGNTFGMTMNYFFRTLGPLVWILAVVAAISLIRARHMLIAMSLGLPVAFYFAVFSMQRTFFERNLSHVVPLLLILSAAGLTCTVQYTRSFTRVRWITGIVACSLFAGAMAPPALLSYRLVFVALPNTDYVRAKDYEKVVERKVGSRIEGTTWLINTEGMDVAIDLATQKEQGVLLRVPDYNDAFTAHNLTELARRVQMQQVGYFPSVFGDLPVSTLNVYHSAAFRYLLLRSKPEDRLSASSVIELNGQRFRALSNIGREIASEHTQLNSWVENGYYPDLRPAAKGRYLGSYAPQLGDKTRELSAWAPSMWTTD
jgi:hypothetical protein